MTHTIDANVFVSALVQTEIQHADSEAFLNALVQQQAEIFCPALILPESVAGIMRPTNNFALAQRCLQRIVSFSGMTLVSLTPNRARQAAEIAAQHRLRGADAIYVAVEFSATLITWDAEMLTRGASAVSTWTPTLWLADQPTPTQGD